MKLDHSIFGGTLHYRLFVIFFRVFICRYIKINGGAGECKFTTVILILIL